MGSESSKLDLGMGFSSSDDCTPQPPPRKRKRRSAKPPPPPLYKATVKELADHASATPADTSVDSSIIIKIKKSLDRAYHENASEQEAKAALFVATKLMARYNLTQAEVLCQATTETERQSHAGHSRVSLRRSDGSDKQVKNSGFLRDLACAIRTFFEVEFYSTRYRFSLDYTFYGIATNTVSAALAFEMTYNLIVQWAREKKGLSAKNSYCLGAASGLRQMARKEKNAEIERAMKAEAEELAAREREEAAQRQRELDRLNLNPEDYQEHEAQKDEQTRAAEIISLPSESDTEAAEVISLPPESDTEAASMSPRPDADEPEDLQSDTDGGSDGDGESDNDDLLPVGSDADDSGIEPDFAQADHDRPAFDNIDDEIDYLYNHAQSSMRRMEEERQASVARSPERSGTPPKPSSPPQQPEDPSPSDMMLDAKWKSTKQLILFRETATKIAEDYLKQSGLKLKKGPKYANAKDHKAWREGREDSKKIDVRRKRIKEDGEGDGHERDD